jgi:nucleotide-binding universal stress UspA family protein
LKAHHFNMKRRGVIAARSIHVRDQHVAVQIVLIKGGEANMIALKQILVATDFSTPSDVAIRYGQDLARAYGATLHAIHVIEDMGAYYGAEVGFALADVERNVEAAARRDLESTIGRHGDRLNVVATVTRASNVAHTITEYATANPIDLIIVGTHGRGAVSRLLMGSVAERVVRSAPCPVLTVRSRERDFVDVSDSQAGLVESPAANHHH